MEQAGQEVSISMSILDLISLAGSIASLILAVLSIWLALYFFIKSKNAESNTSNLLVRVEGQVGLMSKVTSRMLERYVRYSTSPKPSDELLPTVLKEFMKNTSIDHEQSVNSVPARHDTVDDSDDVLDNELVNMYIVGMYWSAIANAALQDRLPEDVAELSDPQNSGLAVLLETSKADYEASKAWLDKNGGDKINSATAAHYWERFQTNSPDGIMRDALETYAARAKQQEKDG